jgi:hypothetical protein
MLSCQDPSLCHPEDAAQAYPVRYRPFSNSKSHCPFLASSKLNVAPEKDGPICETVRPFWLHKQFNCHRLQEERSPQPFS